MFIGKFTVSHCQFQLVDGLKSISLTELACGMKCSCSSFTAGKVCFPARKLL